MPGRSIRAGNRTARWLTETFQPPVVVTVQLLLSPLIQDGFPATMAYGALAVLAAVSAPASVFAMVLAVVGGVVVLAAVSPFWKISGHAAAISCAAVVAVLMLGAAWLPLLLLVPAVGWSRVVLRAHTLAQVLAGSLFGGVVMAGIWWLLRAWLVP
ncbi:phosphatase PAP2 family protein [Arthrobacter sp. BHU FT2]|nr:phosphatase PAP2 family protein [Arthrobacter sp. BHU FT2]